MLARIGVAPAPALRGCAAQHRRRRALSAGAAATSPGDDVAWLGSRFAAGAEQRAQELQMVALKDRLASDSAAEHAGASPACATRRGVHLTRVPQLLCARWTRSLSQTGQRRR